MDLIPNYCLNKCNFKAICAKGTWNLLIEVTQDGSEKSFWLNMNRADFAMQDDLRITIGNDNPACISPIGKTTEDLKFLLARLALRI
jgi:hypothetical protein